MMHYKRFFRLSQAVVVLSLSLWSTAYAQEQNKKTTDGLLTFGQLFTDYQSTWNDAESFNAFELRRAELGLGYDYKRFRFLVNAEAIRSAGEQSLFGIDNNSMVFRVKHAFAQWASEPFLGVQLNLRAGLIPDVWVAQVEQHYDLRGLAPITSEQGRFYDTSDLGAAIGLSALNRGVELNMSWTNGEGRNERELNTGKNASFVLTVRPTAFFKMPDLNVAAHLTYRDGSIGFSSLANHRLGAALTAQWRRIFVGGELIQATGYNIPDPEVGVIDARGFGAWINGAIYPKWLGAALMYRQLQPNTKHSDASREFIAGLYVDAIDAKNVERNVLGFPRLRFYLSYRRLSYDANISPIPGNTEASTVQAIMLTLSARNAKKLLFD